MFNWSNNLFSFSSNKTSGASLSTKIHWLLIIRVVDPDPSTCRSGSAFGIRTRTNGIQ
jgi:hypothetical protein